MIRESIEEYKVICGLVSEASSSVMRYGSTAAAISGSLCVAIASFKIEPDKFNIASIMIITLANVTLFIHLIINYKCASHNRLAAYRNLIAAERFDEAPNSKKSIRPDPCEPAVAFDVCMDHLNHTYAENKFDLDTVKGEFCRKGVFKGLENESILKFISKAFPTKVKFWRGGKEIDGYRKSCHSDVVWRWGALIFFFFALMPGRYKRKGTWSFPDQINRMMGFIVLVEILGSGYLFFKSEITWSNDPLIFSGYIIQGMVSVALLQLVSVQWQELMIGGKRIFSYFVQFVPFRIVYIEQMFGFDDLKIGESIKEKYSIYFVGTEWKLD